MFRFRQYAIRTGKVSTSAKCSSVASDDSDPEVFILVKLLPDLSNLFACGRVDTIELSRPVQSDQDNSLSWKSDGEILVVVFLCSQRHDGGR
jgi:hypothetical protein